MDSDGRSSVSSENWRKPQNKRLLILTGKILANSQDPPTATVSPASQSITNAVKPDLVALCLRAERGS